jgi:uncharacterized repeat protein (TIGR03803 family)
MSELRWWKKAYAASVLCVATAIAAQGQTFTTLAKFNGSNGAEPDLMSLIQGADGNLYGTTEAGGSEQAGTIFGLRASGKLTDAHSFAGPDGSMPYAGLLLASDGNFYGTTGGGGHCGGCGTIFKISPSGNLTTVYIFCEQTYCPDGRAPYGKLVQGVDGDIYGTTFYGGTSILCPSGCGTVFRFSLTGTFTTLHSFDAYDGAGPFAGLAQGLDGNFYGTTSYGSADIAGTVFVITREGQLTSLYFFSDPYGPAGTLTLGRDGEFYGTTAEGPGYGSVFKINAKGSLTILHSFNDTDGAFPYTQLVLGTDGHFYGATSYGGGGACQGGCGTIFSMTSSGSLTTLHTFDGADGMHPMGGMVQDADGTFYGTTFAGGDSKCDAPNGCGTVFSLDMGLSPFVTFVQAAGKVGQTGGILGQGFTGATSVSLNGIPVSFTVKSDTFIEATVPPGATTGYVTVTTPSGTLTSNVPFHVIK